MWLKALRARAMQRVVHAMLRQRWLVRLLRARRVTWMPPGRYVVARHGDVCDVLERNAEFGVTYKPRLDHLGVPFLLGSNDSATYRAQKQVLRDAVRADDLPLVRMLSLDAARRALDRVNGDFDVLEGLADRVIAETVGEYFGVGRLSTYQLAAARTVFRDVFLNGGDPFVTQRAEAAAQNLTDWLDQCIVARAPAIAQGVDPSDDVLARLLRMRAGPGPGLGDPDLRNELSGLVVAWVANVSRSIVLGIDTLLRRPPALAEAQRAAEARDVARVGEFMLEALRFQPPAPAVARTCVREARIGRRTIARDKEVLALLCSAMMDSRVVPEPGAFQLDRAESARLQFGHGIHRCLGAAVSREQVAAVATELLARGRLRRTSRLKWDGPLPRSLGVRID